MIEGYELIPEDFPTERQATNPEHPVVLFVHGAWHDAKSFRLWVTYFRERGYDAAAFSFRGHGGACPESGFA